MSSDIAIKIENLSKCYQIYEQPRDRLKQFILPRLQGMTRFSRKQYFREFWALKDISLQIRKGETVGIVGRNGSGKSTLLQLICGTLNPSSGYIRMNGRIAALLELGAGFNPEFTGRENVYLNASVLGLTREETDQRYDEVIAFADIGDFIDQPIKTYSSGMVVRLAFAVQAAVDPDVLIVDEALAVGDEKFQRKCFARLERLKANGTSILFVSHSGPQVIELCDRAILLDHGLQLMSSTPLEVVRAYHRLIYAPHEEQLHLIQQLISGNKMDENVSEAAPVGAEQSQNHIDYDPSLVPETTTVYPVQGAEIDNIQILNPEGVPVNILTLGAEYQFVVQGRFLSDVNAVHFGVHIRTISGVEVTGQRYPENGVFIPHAVKGSDFRMVFGFRMLLLPDVYFVGGGVWAEQGSNCCHRILDKLMFRLSPPEKQYCFGYMNAQAKQPVLEFI